VPLDLLILGLAFVLILVGAELFTNGIEWFGHKLDLSEGAVGSVLAAVGTALPETTIPLIAILFTGGAAASDVGIGAILGAPFMLATLAMFVLGITVLAVAPRRTNGRDLAVQPGVVLNDVRTFVIAYGLAIAVAFVPADIAWPRWVVAAALVAIYARYVRAHLAAERAAEPPDLAPLRLRRLGPEGHPSLRLVVLQVIVSIGAIVVGATLFVGAIERLTASLGLDPTLLALIIAPMATELPEAVNGVLWARRGKDGLALGNITGAMVFQATVPTVVGLIFASSHWAMSGPTAVAFASAAVAFTSVILISVPLLRGRRLSGRGLLIGGGFYVGYVAFVALDLASGRL
jgi:cation:H+ antiporter